MLRYRGNPGIILLNAKTTTGAFKEDKLTNILPLVEQDKNETFVDSYFRFRGRDKHGDDSRVSKIIPNIHGIRRQNCLQEIVV